MRCWSTSTWQIPCKMEGEHGQMQQISCKMQSMPKCSKYHAKWQILVPNCCKYKANATGKDSHQKNPKPEPKKTKTILNPFIIVSPTWFNYDCPPFSIQLFLMETLISWPLRLVPNPWRFRTAETIVLMGWKPRWTWNTRNPIPESAAGKTRQSWGAMWFVTPKKSCGRLHSQECNKGFYRNAKFQCIPYTCKADEGCSECVSQSLRTADGQCAECRPGYVKTSDNLCEPFTCLTGFGPGETGKAMDHWASTIPGYRASSMSKSLHFQHLSTMHIPLSILGWWMWKAWIYWERSMTFEGAGSIHGVSGEGAACKTCRPQGNRTAHGNLDQIQRHVTFVGHLTWQSFSLEVLWTFGTIKNFQLLQPLLLWEVAMCFLSFHRACFFF